MACVVAAPREGGSLRPRFSSTPERQQKRRWANIQGEHSPMLMEAKLPSQHGFRAARRAEARARQQSVISELEKKVRELKESKVQYIMVEREVIKEKVVEKIVETVIEIPNEKSVGMEVGSLDGRFTAEDVELAFKKGTEMGASSKKDLEELFLGKFKEMAEEHKHKLEEMKAQLEKSLANEKSLKDMLRKSYEDLKAARVTASDQSSTSASTVTVEARHLQNQVDHLRKQILDMQKQVQECQENEDSEDDEDDGSGSNEFEDYDDLRHPAEESDEMVAVTLRKLENFSCSVEGCGCAMTHARCGPAFQGIRKCMSCGTSLCGVEGSFGRKSRCCSKHGHLCLPCAVTDFKQQIRDTLSARDPSASVR